MAQADVILVGGGVIGASCARALAGRGVSVMVLDDGPKPGAATSAAAGMLAPFAEAEPEDSFLGFCVRARDLYTELARELEEETGTDIGLWNEGILQVAMAESDVANLKDTVAWRRQSGFTVDWISVDELREIVPGIGHDALGAAFAPEDGALDPMALRWALLESAKQRYGATFVQESAQQILFEGERVCGVRTAEADHECGAVVIAAGSWSGQVRGVPGPLPVEPIRGQIAALEWPAGEPPAIVYADGGYVLARSGEALAGATMERAGFTATTTEEGIAGVLETARRIYPALAEAPVKRSWAGLRPGTPDGRPVIGVDPVIGNLWYATGHGRNGILLAGITGELLAQEFAGEELEYDLDFVSPGRFRA